MKVARRGGGVAGVVGLELMGLEGRESGENDQLEMLGFSMLYLRPLVVAHGG